MIYDSIMRDTVEPSCKWGPPDPKGNQILPGPEKDYRSKVLDQLRISHMKKDVTMDAIAVHIIQGCECIPVAPL